MQIIQPKIKRVRVNIFDDGKAGKRKSKCFTIYGTDVETAHAMLKECVGNGRRGGRPALKGKR